MKRELDPYTLRWVARQIRREHRENITFADYALLRWARNLESRAARESPATPRKPATKAKRKGRRE